MLMKSCLKYSVAKLPDERKTFSKYSMFLILITSFSFALDSEHFLDFKASEKGEKKLFWARLT